MVNFYTFFIMMNKGTVGGGQEDVLRCKDGSYINVLWSNCLMYDGKGNLQTVPVIFNINLLYLY